MKLFSRLFLVLGITLTGWSSVAWGYTYACEPASSTREFSANFGTYTVTDSSKNTTGALFPDAASYNAGGYASMTCDCESGTLYDRYFWSKTSLANSGVIDGDTYYTVNDNLQASIKIWVGGNVNQYVPLPWTALDNERGMVMDVQVKQLVMCKREIKGQYHYVFQNPLLVARLFRVFMLLIYMWGVLLRGIMVVNL